MSQFRPLKIGLQLPETERVVRWPEMMALARAAEAAGFDSLWLGDHLLYRSPDRPPRAPWEAWSMLAALAVATERVALGPLVAATSFHAPAMLAKKATTVDEISNGRLILGLGAGWNEAEYRAFGFPYDHRASRFEEAFTIIRRLLTGEEVTLDGQYYQVERCLILPESRRPGGPPLMIGSVGERMLRATLPFVDAWNAWYDDFGNDPERFGQLNDRVTALCHELGRNPEEVERTAAVLVQLPDGAGRTTLYTGGPQAQPITGDPTEIAARLREFAAHGADHLQLVLDPITIEGIEAVVEVLPRAREGSQ
jgi:probable F420-dependent oxidoreductase